MQACFIFDNRKLCPEIGKFTVKMLLYFACNIHNHSISLPCP